MESSLNSNLALFKNSKVIPSSGMVASLTVNAESSYFSLMFLYFCNNFGSGVCTFTCHNGQLLQKTDIMRGESNIPFNVTFDTAKKAIITPKTSGNVFYGTILASCNIT